MTAVLKGPSDPDAFRVKVGRYGDRWYCDPMPGDAIAPSSPADEAWPSVSTVKKATGSDWSFVALKRVADAIDMPQYARLDEMPYTHRYEALKAINKLGLSAAGTRGTNVHHHAEARLRGTLSLIHDGDPGAEYRGSVDQFFDQYQPTLVAAEFVCIERTLHGVGYGGTADAIVMIDGRRYIIDWKSRGADSDHGAYPEEAAQLAAYASADYHIIELDGQPVRVKPLRIDGGLIVSIKPDGCRVYPIDLDLAAQHFVSLHAWWCARRDERKSVGRQWTPPKIAAAAGVTTSVVPQQADGPPPFDEGPGRAILNSSTPGAATNEFEGTLTLGTYDPTLPARRVDGSIVPPAVPGPPPFDEPASISSLIPAAVATVAAVEDRALAFVNRPTANGMSIAEQHAALKRAPSEGEPADAKAVTALKRLYSELPAGLDGYIKRLGAEAKRWGLSFNLTERQTVRRFEILRGLVHLAGVCFIEDIGEVVRAIGFSILGDVAMFPFVVEGQIVGSLDASEAVAFAERCVTFASSTVPGSINESGYLVLHFAA